MLQNKAVEKIKTHFMFNTIFLENRAIYVIMRKNAVGLDRSQMTIRRMLAVFWVTKATDTHSEYFVTPRKTVLLEKLTDSQLVKIFPHFMQPESSLPRSQVPAICLYPQPAQSSPQPHIPLPENQP
jgi:hypothetical protein